MFGKPDDTADAPQQEGGGFAFSFGGSGDASPGPGVGKSSFTGGSTSGLGPAGGSMLAMFGKPDDTADAPQQEGGGFAFSFGGGGDATPGAGGGKSSFSLF